VYLRLLSNKWTVNIVHRTGSKWVDSFSEWVFLFIFIFHFQKITLWFLYHFKEPLCYWLVCPQVSTHTVAHSTRPSFRPKANSQPLKNILSLGVSWVKNVKKLQNSDSQSQFSMSKIIRKFLKINFIGKYYFRATGFSKMTSNFWWLLLNWPQDLKTC
jgi:hypothetical protein